MIFEIYFIFIWLCWDSVLADKDDLEKLIYGKENLLGRTLARLPPYQAFRPYYPSEVFPATQLGILNGFNQLPLGIDGRLINSHYRTPAEIFNSQQLVGQKLPTNNFALPQVFNGVKDSTNDFLPQALRQKAARALLSSPAKFSVDDLINLLLVQLLTRYEENNPESIMRMTTKYPVDRSLLPHLNLQNKHPFNPSLQLSSYLSGIDDQRNRPILYSFQKRGRSLNETPIGTNQFIHNTIHETVGTPANPQNMDENLQNMDENPQNMDENLQQSLQKETLIPMFKFSRNNVGQTPRNELDRRVP